MVSVNVHCISKASIPDPIAFQACVECGPPHWSCRDLPPAKFFQGKNVSNFYRVSIFQTSSFGRRHFSQLKYTKFYGGRELPRLPIAYGFREAKGNEGDNLGYEIKREKRWKAEMDSTKFLNNRLIIMVCVLCNFVFFCTWLRFILSVVVCVCVIRCCKH